MLILNWMRMSFKVPNFINYQDQSSMLNYLFNYFGRLFGGDLLKNIVIPFEGWDMDTTDSFNLSYSAVGTNINFMRVVSVSVVVYNNDLSVNYDGTYGDAITSLTTQQVDQNVTITRKSGGLFDSSDFSDASGKVTLWVTT